MNLGTIFLTKGSHFSKQGEERMRVLLSIMILSIFTIVSMVNCEDKFRRMSPEKKAEKIVERISSKLDLNDEQKEKLNKIKDEVVAKIKENRKNRGKFSEEFAEDIKSDKLNRDKMLQFLNQRAEKRYSMHGFMVDKFIEFHSILTPEQREKMSEKIKEFSKKFHKHHH